MERRHARTGVLLAHSLPNPSPHHTKPLVAGSGKLVAAHFHCHAPTCLSMTLYNNKTGEVICREEPIYGGGTFYFTFIKIAQVNYDTGAPLSPPWP